MNAAVQLERFDDGEENPSVSLADMEAALEQARAEGYAEAEAIAAAQRAEEAALFESAAAAIHDATELVKEQLNGQFLHILTGVVERVLPELAQARMVNEAMATLQAIEDIDLCGVIAITCHDAHVEQLERALAADYAECGVKIIPDPDASPLSVGVSWREAGIEIDLEAAIANCVAYLKQANSTAQEDFSHD